MKPEHFCSGNGKERLIEMRANLRFNEAGAFLLRKLGADGDAPQTKTSFNEAGAFLLRKPPVLPTVMASSGALQ